MVVAHVALGPWVILLLLFGAVALLAAWSGRAKRKWKVEGWLQGADFRAVPLLVNPPERAAWDFLNQWPGACVRKGSARGRGLGQRGGQFDKVRSSRPYQVPPSRLRAHR